MIDFGKIEGALGVKLPQHYVSFMRQFKGFAIEDAGLVDNFIYKDTDKLIRVNRSSGFHLTEKPIKKKLIIGDNGGGDYYLIDLQHAVDERVHYFDHEASDNAGEMDVYPNLLNFKEEVEGMF
jgi:hypothetical protein